MTPQERKKYDLDIAKTWTDKAKDFLVGKTIWSVRYMNDKEMEDFMWSKKPIIIEFTDGSYIIPQRDDEGNDGGALFTSDDNLDIIPVI
jgi:hypothetical protein